MSRSKPPIEKEINKVHNVVWATIKCIDHSLEEKDVNSDNDFFYTRLGSLSKPIFVETKEHMQSDSGVRCSQILLTYDKKIVLNQGLDVGVECKNNWLLLFSCALCKEIT
jgi:hypothetical protein